MPRRYYSSTAARTTLSSSCNNSDTTLSVTAVSGWPSSFPYTLIIDQDTINEEVVNVTARTGTTLTVERGQDGTTAVSHLAGASVNHGVSARDFNEPNQFLNEGGTVTGQTVVSSSGSGTTLEVRNTGTGNSFVVEDSANPDSTPFVVDSSGNVGIGTSTPSERLTVAGDILISDATPILKFVDTDNNADAQIDGGNGNLTFRADANDEAGSSSMVWTIDGTERMRITSAGNVGIGTSNVAYTLDVVGSTGARVGRFAGAPVVAITRAEGSSASPTIVTNGSTVGGVYFQGYDGSAYRSTAAVLSDVDGTPGASDMPGRLTFLTTADGAATLSERMRITSAGNVGIGTSSPGANLHMAANGSNALRIERADDSAASPIIAFW